MEMVANKIKIKIQNIILVMLFLTLAMTLSLFGSKVNEQLVTIQILLLVFLYVFILSVIIVQKSTSSILCDGRFYFITLLFLYSSWAPIFILLGGNLDSGILLRSGSINIYYFNSNELVLSLWSSLLLFFGMLVGFLLRFKSKEISNEEKVLSLSEVSEHKRNNLMSKRWLFISIICTGWFLYPFLSGGFSILKTGSILGVYKYISNINRDNQWNSLINYFFGWEVMTISYIAAIYYKINSNATWRNKIVFSLLLIVGQFILMVMTTRRARAIIIIACVFVILQGIRNSQMFSTKKIKNLNLIFGIGLLFAYFLEAFQQGQFLVLFIGSWEERIRNFMVLFDGIGPYDGLMSAIRSTPNLAMFGNIIYGLFRDIPFMGKYIIQFFGIDASAPPMFHWMAAKYPLIYHEGGGLAYLPQQEAYLAFGLIGCVMYGVVYGLIFGKKRSGLSNLIVVAMSFAVARGNMQVMLSLCYPYIIIGYVIYDKILLRIGIKSDRKEQKTLYNSSV